MEFYQKLFSFPGLPDDFLNIVSVKEDSELSKNGSRLVTLSFWLVYCGLGLLIIQLYFMNLTITKIALGLYACMFLFTLVLNETGKGLEFEPLRVIAYRLMTLMV